MWCNISHVIWQLLQCKYTECAGSAWMVRHEFYTQGPKGHSKNDSCMVIRTQWKTSLPSVMIELLFCSFHNWSSLLLPSRLHFIIITVMLYAKLCYNLTSLLHELSYIQIQRSLQNCSDGTAVLLSDVQKYTAVWCLRMEVKIRVPTDRRWKF